MKSTSRLFLLGALTLVLLTAACAGQQVSPTSTAQATSTAATETPTATVSPTDTTTATRNTTLTPGIPITGLTVSLVCQFCIDGASHALVAMPAAATFTLLTPTATVSTTNVATSCNTVEKLNDKQVVLCLGPSNTLITLNVCAGNCQQFTVRLQTCPPVPVATFTRTPTSTPTASVTPTLTPVVSSPTSASPTSTSVVSSPTSAATESPTATMTLTPTATP